MVAAMLTEAEARGLVGRQVRLRLTPAGGGAAISGKLVGTLEAADGLVLFLEPPGEPGKRVTCHYQHVEAVEEN